MTHHPDETQQATTKAPQLLTAYDQMVLESCKEMYKNSMEVGRDFVKQLISICTASLPVYVSLLKITSFEQLRTSWHDAWFFGLMIAPGLLLLVALLLFIWALSPMMRAFTPWQPADIETVRRQVIETRLWRTRLATYVFTIGVLFAVVLLAAALFHEGGSSPASLPVATP